MNPTKVRHPRSFEPARRRMRECGGGAGGRRERRRPVSARQPCRRPPLSPPARGKRSLPIPGASRRPHIGIRSRNRPIRAHLEGVAREPLVAGRRGALRASRDRPAPIPFAGADPVRRCRSRSQVPIPFAEVALGLSSPGDQPGSAPRGRLGPCNAPTGVEVQGLRSGAQGEGLKVQGSRSRP
jgi:hypothetical protein